MRKLKELQATGADVVLVSQGSGACHAAAGAAFGSAVGYREPPGIPRWRGHGTAAESGDPAAGIVCADSRSRAGWPAESGALGAGFGVARSARRWRRRLFRRCGRKALRVRPIVYFDERRHREPFSVRKALGGKRVLLIGVTGFIGKVWLANTLIDLPEIGKLYLLIRRQKSSPAQRRFEKMIEGRRSLIRCLKNIGDRLGALLAEKMEVVEGDVSQPGLGLDPEVADASARRISI